MGVIMIRRRFFSTEAIKAIESKWRIAKPVKHKDGPKYYALSMFPYPSGSLHMGHVRVYTISDTVARYMHLRGHNVLHPMGWDAFGLPAENAAKERGIPPEEWTPKNIEQMSKQLDAIGCHFDWEANANTSHPDYYRWTQWIFLRMWRAGLVYRQDAEVNWDPIDRTVLANEQVSEEGRSWRSGAMVEKRMLSQWYLRITAYADRLKADLESLPLWPTAVKEMQKNWIYEGDRLRLRDWLISRQRYWGCPIPVVHCETCGIQALPEAELPVRLPRLDHFSTAGNPLESEAAAEWRSCKCPQCQGPAKRETDTMDTFMDSSWYFLRYTQQPGMAAFDPKALQHWMPVDVYIGGIEHAILHLLYARFVSKFLADHFQVAELQEPFKQLITQGLVEGKTLKCPLSGRYLKPDEIDAATGKIVATGETPVESWEKMSKSKYNGVDPIGMIRKWGQDTCRLYMLFKAPPEVPLYWNDREISGPHRWLTRLLRFRPSEKSKDSSNDLALNVAVNEALKHVGDALDPAQHTFNTAIAALMKLTNQIEELGGKCSPAAHDRAIKYLSIMLYPMAPLIAAELFSRFCPQAQVWDQAWPQPIEINEVPKPRLTVTWKGRFVANLEYDREASEETIIEAARRELAQRNRPSPSSHVLVPNRCINFY